MATITYNIQVSKQRVMDEVAKTTAYIGSKSMSAEDPGAYLRIASIDADREQLDRYWMEACSGASLLLDHWMVSVTTQVLTHHPELDNDYKAVIAMPTNWPSQYLTTLNESLISYMVNYIVSKWLLIVLPAQAEGYAALASGEAGQVSQLLLVRKRPIPRRSGPSVDDGLWYGADIWYGADQW